MTSNIASKSARAALVAAAACGLAATPVFCAENLRLQEGASFLQDSDSGFPIVADNFADVRIESGKANFIFFGASGDFNTNRQAKRVIDVYNKIHGENVKFILVDVDHPPAKAGSELIKKYYRGYIPGEVLIDAKGYAVWNQIGEIETQTLKNRIESVL